MPYDDKQYLEPFDADLNDAIFKITDHLVPRFEVNDNAPDTYPKLKAHLDAGRVLTVAAEGSDCTIFGVPEVNYAFRAWHDWCHWQRGFDFSLFGESGTCNVQIGQLRSHFGVNAQTDSWARLLVAEIIGQRQYYERYLTYIVNQRAFVRAHIKNTDTALSRRW